MSASDGRTRARVLAALFSPDLAMDLIESAVLDLGATVPRADDAVVSEADREAIIARTLRWIDGGEAPIGFADCCEALHLNMSSVQRYILSRPLVGSRQELENALTVLRESPEMSPGCTPRPSAFSRLK